MPDRHAAVTDANLMTREVCMRASAVVASVSCGILVSSQLVLGQDTSEVETILYEAADTLGMLRTPSEVDRLLTMIYSGTGTTMVGDQPCSMESYRASVRYPIPNAHHTFPVPAMRVDFTCPGNNGESERHIQVVAGELAWNETEPGIGATPAPETVDERLQQLWLLPHSLVKAAVAAGPRTVASTEGGNPVLTFPLPAPLDDTTVEITLDPSVFLHHTMPNGLRREFSHRITRVETEFDGDAIVVNYADYRDWNEDDYKADVLLPGRIVQTRDGATVFDLTLNWSNTYNPYVVMPVPDGIPWEGAGATGL